MPRERSRKVPKMRVWGLPSTRKVATQVIATKKEKQSKRSALKLQLIKELKELKK